VLGRVETVSPFDGWDNEARTLVKLPPFSWLDFSTSSDERKSSSRSLARAIEGCWTGPQELFDPLA
jgi:hypothetical protein